MTQYAIIKKLTGPDTAEAEVLRGTACGGDCGSCETCHYASKLRVEVKNELGAMPGDRGWRSRLRPPACSARRCSSMSCPLCCSSSAMQ